MKHRLFLISHWTSTREYNLNQIGFMYLHVPRESVLYLIYLLQSHQGHSLIMGKERVSVEPGHPAPRRGPAPAPPRSSLEPGSNPVTLQSHSHTDLGTISDLRSASAIT